MKKPAPIKTERYRSLDAAAFAGVKIEVADFGAAPMLQWIKISDLVVDPNYQREIGGSGRRNIGKIVANFSWTKFATVVVAPIEGGRYAIVDGQHRTTAAGARGIEQIPCQVIVADPKTQAAAFAAINANITEMSPMQVHAAKTAAGDAAAIRLNKLCAEAGVTICRYPIPSNKMKVGETLAAGALYRMLEKFGEEVLVTALSCITRTRNGYPGFLRSPLITALCVVLEAEPGWLESRKLLKAMGQIDLAGSFQAAWKTATAGSGGGAVGVLVDVISAHLEGALGEVAA